MKLPQQDKGMTLIELVVAMAIFALVAIMGLQGLSGMLRIRDRLTEVDQDTAALSRAVAMMRNDLTAIMPMRFFPPDGPSINALSINADSSIFSLSISGQPDLAGDSDIGRIQRAEWQVDPQEKRLIRRVWTTLTPVDRQQLQPETEVMQGVQGLRTRSYWAGQGWVEGPNSPLLQSAPKAALSDEDRAGGAPDIYSDFIPMAIEITLVTVAMGEITLIETLK